MKAWIVFISLLFIGISCSKEKKMTIEELRQREIDKRVSQFMETKKQECYSKSMDLAIHLADSLLKLQAVKYIEDSLQRPPLPIKPEMNIRPTPNDSIQNRPFFLPDTARIPDTTRKDG